MRPLINYVKNMQLQIQIFFKYLQICSFVKTSFPTFPSQPPNSEMNTILLKDPHKKGSISRICDLLLSKEHMPTLDGIKEAWQQDIGLNITASQWTKALDNVHSSSICARHGLLQFKVLHRLHFSKVRLAKMFPGIDSTCDRCGQDQATLAHTFWSCPNIVPYWIKIFDMMSDVCQVRLCPAPVLALFGAPSAMLELSSKQKTVIRFVTVLSRRLILLNWKNKNPPTFKNLLNDILKHVQLEKIRFELKEKIDDFHQTWDIFLQYCDRYNG